MYRVVRPLLFRLEPETAHTLTVHLLRLAGRLAPVRFVLSKWFSAPERPVQAFGLKFKNPIGLAAGYDKDGLAWRGLACLGFGHIEIGTVTPLAQPGNPKPRVYRLVEDRALVNRMGFPGKGAEFVARQISGARPPDLILGVNIGKNKATSLEAAAEDYLMLVRQFACLGDYLAINVSSPNTEGLRRLQARQALEDLLRQVARQRQELLAAQPGVSRMPILVKLSPDLNDDELHDALDAIVASGMDGVIATNTTLQRQGLRSRHAREMGGMSGAPLFSCSLAMVQQINRLTGGSLPVIGVGGVGDASDVQAMLDSGAALVQVYTSLVYQGPGLVQRILRRLK